MKDISHNIEDWLFRYQEGLLTETERGAVERYLAAHPDAQALLAAYNPRLRLPKDLPLTDAAGCPLSYPRKEALQRPSAAGSRGRPAPAETHQRRLISRRSIWTAAACAALFLVLGITFVMRFDDPLSSPVSHPFAQVPASTPQPLALAKTAPSNAPSAAKSQAQAKPQTQAQTQTKPAAQALPPTPPTPAECFEPAEPTKAEPMEVLPSNQLIAYVETPADSPAESLKNGPGESPEDPPATTVDNLIAYAEPQHNFLHRLASWTGLRRKNELSQGLYAAGDQLEELSASISATWRELQRNPQILGEYAYAYVVRTRENSRESSKMLRAGR